MTALFGTIFVASLIGSLHCVGMCGGIVAMCVGLPDESATSKTALQLAYHGGRLISYTTLGVIFGSLGTLLNASGQLAGLTSVAAWVAGSIMIVAGLVALLRMCGSSIPKLQLPAWMMQLIQRAHGLAFRFPPKPRAFIIGILTAFLPCGWLWAFLAVAAGTASPMYGGLSMAIFWSGTVPALFVVGLGFGSLSRAMQPYVPRLTALLLLLCGALTIAMRMPMSAAVLPDASPAHNVSEAIEHIHTIDQETLPCCE